MFLLWAAGCLVPRSPQQQRAAAPAGSTTSTDVQRFIAGDRSVTALLADGPVMWMGTSGGVVRYDSATQEVATFDAKNSGLLSSGILYLGKIDDRLWVGTYGGGLSIFDGQDWVNYNVPHGLADAFVYGVARATNGDLWIATWSGANRVIGGRLDDPSAWTTFTVENTAGGLPNDWVYTLQVDASGSVWFATEGGLAFFDGRVWRSWNNASGLGAPYETIQDSLLRLSSSQYSEHHSWRASERQGEAGVNVAYNPNYIVAMLLDSKGRVLCGTWGGGLSVMRDGRFERTVTKRDGLSGNYILMLHEDAEGDLWVGTSEGLTEIKRGSFDAQFKTYTVRDGLYSNVVFSMVFDDHGFPWVGGLGGAVQFKKSLR